MIYDSRIWKIDLRNELNIIETFFRETDLNYDEDFEEAEGIGVEERDMGDVAFIKLQKFAIYTSIIIRKLIEARKISDELMSENFPINIFDKVDNTKVVLWNGYEIEKLYDMENEKKSSISIAGLMHAVIHSFHFMPKYNLKKDDESLPDEDYENWINDGLLGLYFSSDKTKDKYLSYISFETYLKIIGKIVNDRIVHIVRNGDGEIIKTSIKTSD